MRYAIKNKFGNVQILEGYVPPRTEGDVKYSKADCGDLVMTPPAYLPKGVFLVPNDLASESNARQVKATKVK